MRITQAHISDSVSSFPWLEKLGLTPYANPDQPAIFFGMYRPTDLGTLYLHKDIAVVRWCGVDSLNITRPALFTDPLVHNISPFAHVVNKLSSHGISCKKIGIENIYSLSSVKPYGDKVYIYMPRPDEYYGLSVINEIVRRGHNVIIGDGSIPRSEWDAGKADEIYDQCYAGLVLSRYVGGGGSVVELGLKGRMCITNVLDTPNAIPWQTIDDIILALDTLKGDTVERAMRISEKTYAALSGAGWLNTEYYVSH